MMTQDLMRLSDKFKAVRVIFTREYIGGGFSVDLMNMSVDDCYNQLRAGSPCAGSPCIVGNDEEGARHLIMAHAIQGIIEIDGSEVTD